MKTKLIACAFVITIAYHIILENVDCASIRRKKQKSGQSYNVSENWTGSPIGFKVNDQQTLFTDLPVVGAKADSARITMAVASDFGNQSNSVAPKKRIKIPNSVHKAKKQLEEDDRIKLNVEVDPGQDDNNDAGAGLVGVKNAIENLMKPNIFVEDSKDWKKTKDINGAKERRKAKDNNGEMLRFKSNDDGGEEVERRMRIVSIFT